MRYTDPSPDDVTLSAPTTASDVFVVAHSEDRVVGWRYYSCGPGDVVDVTLTVGPDGISTERLACLP